METILLIVIGVASVALAIVRQMKSGAGRDGDDDRDSTGQARRQPSTAKPRGTDQDDDNGGSETVSTPHKSKPGADVGAGAPSVTGGAVCRNACGVGLFANVRSWGYQLQKVNVDAVANSPFDVMVIDYSKDGSDDHVFATDEIERMQVKPDGMRRLVLSYMSIGEAESYRYYWNPDWTTNKPAWLLDENPDWPENYSVAYWDPSWQSLFYGGGTSYIDRLIDAGFDGVYLDKCDVFEDLQARNKKVAASRGDLEGDMVAFVQRLSHYAKSRNPRFAIVMQNAEVLLEHEALREAIDGVAKEELLYGYDTPEKANPKDEVTFSKRALDLALSSGRTVFVVEYLNDTGKIRQATQTIDGYGYISTVSPKNRKLASLNPDPMVA